jgi:type II secretory pathway pseudopilin PulG
MTKRGNIAVAETPHSSFDINSPFALRPSSFRHAFTVIELLLVVGIIIVLTGLVLSTAGYAWKKSARTRAETEIAAISAACENYKTDNGVYPSDPSTTEQLDPTASGNPNTAAYNQPSVYLYSKLSGDSTGSRSPTGKSYMVFKPNMLLPTGGTGTVTAIADPFGYSYGYSTRMAANGSGGYNPTFDLWSTAGLTTSPPTAADQNQWIKNW